MSTIDHGTIRAGDRDSMVKFKFYDHLFDLLNFAGDRHAGDVGVEWGDFSLAEADAERAPTEGLHIAFTADSHELVDSWWRGMIDAGYRSDGEPGPRPQYRPDYYGAFVLDGQGNSAEAVTHGGARERATGLIDHLWIRVQELEPIRPFYGLIAPVLGLKARDLGERFGLVAEAGSFTFTEGRPTRNLHLDRSRRPADGGRVLRERARGRRPRQRSARREAVLPPRLLRRLRHRSSRDEPRSRLPRSESHINVCIYLDGNNIEVVNHNR